MAVNGQRIVDVVPTGPQKDALDGASPTLSASNAVTGVNYTGYPTGGLKLLTGSVTSSSVNTALGSFGVVVIDDGATLTMDGNIHVYGGRTLIGPGMTTVAVPNGSYNIVMYDGSAIRNFSFQFGATRTQSFIYVANRNMVIIENIYVNTLSYHDSASWKIIEATPSSGGYLKLNNVQISNSGTADTGRGIWVTSSGGKWEITNCRVAGVYDGFQLSGNGVLLGCNVGSTQGGNGYILSTTSGDYIKCIGNRATLCAGSGFVVSGATGGILFLHCVGNNNSAYGFDLAAVSGDACATSYNRATGNSSGQFNIGSGWYNAGNW